MLRVIADDLTGACDVGAELAAAGLPTRVCVDGRMPPPDPAWLDVVNTQSRTLAAPAAYERVLRLARDTVADVLLKKIDTALRGHLGAELEAALDGLGAIAAFVVPAIPAAGRVTRGGAQWFDGHLLSATEFARDPEGGGAEASIAAVLARESRKRTEVIASSVVRAGRLPERVLALARAGTAFFVVDAETDADLTAAVNAILELPRPLCLAGSIGLARALAPHLGPTAARAGDTAGERHGCGPPALIVLGSLHSTARAQIESLADAGEATILTVPAPDAPESVHAALVTEAATRLAAGMNVVLAAPPPAGVPDPAARRATERLLADLSARAVATVPVGTLVLVGGETSHAVLNRLGAATLAVRGRFAPLVAVAEILSGQIAGATLVTKGGSGGDRETLRALLGRAIPPAIMTASP